MSGSSPVFNGISLNAIYACNRPEKARFEIEGIGSADGGKNMYMLANVQNEKGGDQTDSIYEIKLE